MKTSRFLSIALVAGLLFGVSQTQAQAASQLPETNFTYVGSWSSLTLFKNFEKPFWGEDIEKASDGKITAQVTTFDQMGVNSGAVFRILQKGVFDIGATVADYEIPDAPALEGLDMPTIAPDVATAHKVVKAFKPVLADIMHERFNAKLLAVAPYPPQVVFCNVPISGLADLAGKKVRAAGRSEAEFLEAIGADGITMEYNEVPGALQRGVIDCAVTGSLSGYSSAWYESSNYLYSLPIGGWDYVVTAMNGDTWDSLDPKLQDWLQKQIDKNFEKPVWKAAAKMSTEGIACLTGKEDCSLGKPAHMKLVEPSKEDIKLAREALTEHVLPSWAKSVDKKWVQRWNKTIGKVVDLKAQSK